MHQTYEKYKHKSDILHGNTWWHEWIRKKIIEPTHACLRWACDRIIDVQYYSKKKNNVRSDM